MTKLFAITKLSTLATIFFNNEDEWKEALRTFKRSEIPTKWMESMNRYCIVESL